jgi:hypothetical protein
MFSVKIISVEGMVWDRVRRIPNSTAVSGNRL